MVMIATLLHLRTTLTHPGLAHHHREGQHGHPDSFEHMLNIMSIIIYMGSFITFTTSHLSTHAPLLRKVNKKYVHFENGQWHSHQMKQICPFIEVWKPILLDLTNNHNHKIIMEIGNIVFPEIKKINLSCNNIESIEPLIRTSMPCLKQLSLTRNNIVKIRPLCKGYWPALSFININQNKLTDTDRLMDMGSNAISSLIIEVSGCSLKRQEIKWIAKLSTPQLQYLEIMMKIPQSKTKQALIRKYLNILILP